MTKNNEAGTKISNKIIEVINVASLRHNQATDLKAGKINNHDAALLILNASGGTTSSRQIIEGLKAFRHNPELKFVYLFNTSDCGGYGFVGCNVNSVSNTVYHHAPLDSRATVTQRRTYWYRVKHGHYSITLEGLRRLAEMKAQLETA